MTNMIIMVHHPFSESMLNRVFLRIPNVKVINIPLEWCSRSFELQIAYLHNTLQANGLDYSNIDFFLVESNYGKATSSDINTELFNHILNNFRNAKIFASSNTTESLAKALHYNERINIMNNSEIRLSSSRIYSIGRLKEVVESHNQPLSARERSNPATQIVDTLESDISTQRRNTLPILTSFLSANTDPVSEERPPEERGAEIHRSDERNSLG